MEGGAGSQAGRLKVSVGGGVLEQSGWRGLEAQRKHAWELLDVHWSLPAHLPRRRVQARPGEMTLPSLLCGLAMPQHRVPSSDRCAEVTGATSAFLA